MALLFVRVAQKLTASWLARHEKDGLNEWKLSSLVKSQYAFGAFDWKEENVEIAETRLGI